MFLFRVTRGELRSVRTGGRSVKWAPTVCLHLRLAWFDCPALFEIKARKILWELALGYAEDSGFHKWYLHKYPLGRTQYREVLRLLHLLRFENLARWRVYLWYRFVFLRHVEWMSFCKISMTKIYIFTVDTITENMVRSYSIWYGKSYIYSISPICLR